MKKITSILMSLAVLMSAVIAPVHAQTENEIIIKAGESNFTVPAGTSVGGLGGDWAKDNEATYFAMYDLTANTPENTYITYTGMPAGEYELYYYICGSNNSDGTYRSARALDCDISVTDAYGTYTTVSVKPYIGYSGYVSVGTYCFDGVDDTVKITANPDDNKTVNDLGQRMLVTHSIKLVPVAEHSDLLSAVNSAANVRDVRLAVENLGGTYIDGNSLNYMGDVYKSILENRPANGYTNAHEIKIISDEAIKNGLTKSDVITSKLFVYNSGNGEYRHYAQANISGDGNALAMFKDIPMGNIKKVELKLDFVQIGQATNVEVMKAADSIYEKDFPVGQARNESEINAGITYKELSETKKVATGFKDITDEVLKSAVNKKGALTLLLMADYTLGNDMGLCLNPVAYLRVTYDNTVDTSKMIKQASVNTSAANTSKVFDFDGFDSISSVKVNGTQLTDDQFGIKATRLKINADVFAQAGSYSIEISDGKDSRNCSLTLNDGIEINMQDSFWNFSDKVPEADSNNGLIDTGNYTSYGYTKCFWVNNSNEWGYTKDDVYVKFTGIPEGEYRVEYYAPYTSETANSSVEWRNGWGMLTEDVDVEVKDVNGSKISYAVRPDFICGGYIDIGNYTFNGADDYIKVAVNEDNKTKSDINPDRFVFTPGKIRLSPVKNDKEIEYYFANGTSFVDDVNNAESAEQVRNVIETKGTDIIDVNSLNNMHDVYSEIFEGKPYASANCLERAVEKAVSKRLVTKEYNADTIISTFNKMFRVMPEFKDDENFADAYKLLVFKNVSADRVKKVELKLNIPRYTHNMTADKYSLTAFTATDFSNLGITTDAENRFITEYVKNLKPMQRKTAKASASDMGNEIVNSMNELTDASGDVSIKINPDPVPEIKYYGGDSGSKISGATLVVTYDTTANDDKLSIAKAAAKSESLSSAKQLVRSKADYLGISEEQAEIWAIALYGESIVSIADVEDLLSNVGKYDCIFANDSIDYEGSRISGTINVKNVSGAIVSPKVLAAAYKNGKMLSMAYAELKAESDGIGNYAFELNADNADLVKVFALDSVENIKPLTKAYEKVFYDTSKKYAADTLLKADGSINSEYDGEITVACIGGSLTAGDSDYSGNSITGSSSQWPMLVKDYVASQYPQATVKLVNAGVGGNTSYACAARYESELLSYNPDLVFIEHTVNDIVNVSKLDELYQYIDAEKEMQMSLRANKIPVIVYLNLPIPVETDDEKYAGWVTSKQAKEAVMEHYGVKTIDVSDLFRQKHIDSGTNKYFVDWLEQEQYYPRASETELDTHPNPKGYKMFAQVITESFDKNGFNTYLNKLRNPEKTVVGEKFGKSFNNELKMSYTRTSASASRFTFNGSWTLYTVDNPYEFDSNYPTVSELQGEKILGEGIMQTLGTNGNSFEFTTDANEIIFSLCVENEGKSAEIYIDGEYKTKIGSYYKGLSKLESMTDPVKISDDNSEHKIKVVVLDYDETSGAETQSVFRFKYLREVYYSNNQNAVDIK